MADDSTTEEEINEIIQQADLRRQNIEAQQAKSRGAERKQNPYKQSVSIREAKPTQYEDVELPSIKDLE